MIIYTIGGRANNMADRSLASVPYLVRGVIFSPNRFFKQVADGENTKEILFIFIMGSILTFAKTFLVNQGALASTFFLDDKTIKLLTFVSIPQVTWIIGYAGYFLFIFCILALSKVFNRKAQMKSLVLSLMSISGLGVVMQILFYGFQFFIPKELLSICTYIVFFWVILLSLSAIKSTQAISLPKSLLCFFIPAVFFIPFTVGLPVVAPYLAWVNFY